MNVQMQCLLCDRHVPMTMGGVCRACDDTHEGIQARLRAKYAPVAFVAHTGMICQTGFYRELMRHAEAPPIPAAPEWHPSYREIL